MTLPHHFRQAIYRDTGLESYRGNPLIEALPPIMTLPQVKKSLIGALNYNASDIFTQNHIRVHLISQLLDDFFQPISKHLQLENKLSIMIRQGYVGRNLNNGSLHTHMQNGYERIMSGDLNTFRFEQAKSTARSLSLIGCSGSGKSTTLNRILATYPQVIFHQQHNFTQITYLKIDCPHDGSLKNLCHHFFRAIDQALSTDYERKYALKRHSVETLLAIMSQTANVHAIGVLVIDEIQHLSMKQSGGVEKMLNFFVTLVNVIGLPVVLVGTPKARPIFETDLRSARRGAGFGAFTWEPMQAEPPTIDPDTNLPRKTEWIAFTNALWKYQWLQKRDHTLSDEIRDCWYDLSQGVLDIVVKLFVLAQMRAIAVGVERITVSLLKQVYSDELKPVHPMLAALRSGDPERIIQYSDLTIPDIDIRLLKLSKKIDEMNSELDLGSKFYNGNEQAERLHNLLVDLDCQSDLVVPLVRRAFDLHPNLTTRELVPLILNWYNTPVETVSVKPPKTLTQKTKRENWHTLDTIDLRFQFSQSTKESTVYNQLKNSGAIFDAESWLRQVS